MDLMVSQIFSGDFEGCWTLIMEVTAVHVIGASWSLGVWLFQNLEALGRWWCNLLKC